MSNPTAPAHAIAATGDPLLLTPGPLTNSRTVKEAMLHDWGSRDGAFVAINGEVLAWLPGVVHAATSHVAVPLQGSGRCAVEAMLTDFAPTCGEVLLLIDRACGHRARKIPAIAASSNTCIERVPGRGFALCRHEALAAARGNATTLVPDPHDQWAGPQQTGHYRCAPLRCRRRSSSPSACRARPASPSTASATASEIADSSSIPASSRSAARFASAASATSFRATCRPPPVRCARCWPR